MIVQTLHGALECAIFAQNMSDAQIVSIGPTVFGAHTPDEAVNKISCRLLEPVLSTSNKKITALLL